MLRSLLAVLLLANYLLVVSAGLLVGRPEKPDFSAAHPYVHSAQCQQHHYLRLDCFERCQGQPAFKAKLPGGSGLHMLAQLKGLDVHWASAGAWAARPPCWWRPVAPVGARTQPAAELAGHGGPPAPPPWRLAKLG